MPGLQTWHAAWQSILVLHAHPSQVCIQVPSGAEADSKLPLEQCSAGCTMTVPADGMVFMILLTVPAGGKTIYNLLT